MHTISESDLYLSRMAKPLLEKLKIIKFFPKNTKLVLDVGCADGSLTIEMAKMFPDIKFVGIDLNTEFIKKASEATKDIENVSFEAVYLRELLSRNVHFDAVTFSSVLHEFYSYGEGTSSVLKAISDAHELLHRGGRIIIRDMIFSEYKKHTTLWVNNLVDKIVQKSELLSLIEDFEKYFGKLNDNYTINHFLLKYKYKENWEREGRENYVPVTFDKYEQIFSLLDMKILYKKSYLLPYFHDLWSDEFGFTEDELSTLSSTGVFVAEKN